MVGLVILWAHENRDLPECEGSIPPVVFMTKMTFGAPAASIVVLPDQITVSLRKSSSKGIHTTFKHGKVQIYYPAFLPRPQITLRVYALPNRLHLIPAKCFTRVGQIPRVLCKPVSWERNLIFSTPNILTCNCYKI